jgi:tripartite-type tricarboxylate transporter receptor subunit TctC
MTTRKHSNPIVPMSVFIILAFATFSGAADYPTKPITIVNPMAPGGNHDVVTRAFAAVAEKYLGQPVLVVNKPGASGMIGIQSVVQAAPDGYTLLADGTLRVTVIEWETVNGRTSPVTKDDLTVIGCYTMSPAVVVVPYNSKWKTPGDLIEDCKSKPNHYAFCSAGFYSATHTAVEVFLRTLGIKARHVPYKGGGPCVSALVGEHVDFSCQLPTTCIPLSQGNKVKILAVQGDRRLKLIPEIPTVKELGIDAEYYIWVGLTAPRKTPRSIVEKLAEVTKKVSADEAFRRVIEKAGDEVRTLNSDELVRFCDKESQIHAKFYKQILQDEKK